MAGQTKKLISDDLPDLPPEMKAKVEALLQAMEDYKRHLKIFKVNLAKAINPNTYKMLESMYMACEKLSLEASEAGRKAKRDDWRNFAPKSHGAYEDWSQRQEKFIVLMDVLMKGKFKEMLKNMDSLIGLG
jgi:hypothetical protein